MKGLLVYDPYGAKRNAEFIEKLTASAKARGIELKLCLFDANFSIDKDIDFAAVRTVAPALSAELEKRGIRVFNNSETSKIANDKWLTYSMCRKLGIPTVPTYDKIPDEPLLPCVVKSRNGHGGAEVYLTTTSADLTQTCNGLTAVGKTYIVQKLATPSKDMRLYMLGGEVVASVLRTSDADFRSNFSLGGKCELCPPTAEQVDIAKRVCARLRCDYVGIDFIPYNGDLVLNEIEDVVGARMLYELTDIDIAEKFAEYIRSEIKKTR